LAKPLNAEKFVQPPATENENSAEPAKPKFQLMTTDKDDYL